MPRRGSTNDNSIRLTVPGYREKYGVHDFTNPEARVLDDQIARHLYSSAKRILWGHAGELILEVAGDSRSAEKEKETVEAYHSMFRWRARGALRRFGRQVPLVGLLIVLAALFLWLAHRIEGLDWGTEAVMTAAEAIRLGAWVSGWTAISLIFSQGIEALRKYRVFHHLSKVPIRVEYPTSTQSSMTHDRSRETLRV